MKSKEQKQREAAERQKQRAERSPRRQLNLLYTRPGKSDKERTRIIHRQLIAGELD